MGLFTTSKPTAGKGQQGNQVAPGQFFRVPGMGARTRWVPEGGNKGIRTTLTTGTTNTAPTVKFDQSDIVAGYLAVVKFTGTFTKTTTHKAVASPFAPMNLVNRLKIQYEATYAPVNLSGIMAAVMQSYRPVFAPADSTVGLLTNETANVIPANLPGGNWPSFTSFLTKKTGFTGNTITGAYTFTLFFELPVSIEFDLYWPLNKDGSLANNSPLPRRIISPQYMAATTRNNVPVVTFANPVGAAKANSGRLPLTYAATTTHKATFTGHTTLNVYRSGWFPGNRAATPPIDPWQYARLEMQWPTNGTTAVTIPLDSQEADQGQIMSVVFYTFDPTSTSTLGLVVPLTHVVRVALLYSSDVNVRNQIPAVNQFEWSTKHGFILPKGFCGWDLALTYDGRLTNEDLLNTYVQSGVQIRITYTPSHVPSSSSQVYLGIETLKFVTQ